MVINLTPEECDKYYQNLFFPNIIEFVYQTH